MSEKNFWTLIRNSLRLRMYRIENKVSKGTPDIHYIQGGSSGWIELKYMRDWPKGRVSSGLMLNQCLWLKEYNANKGQGWILIRIGRDFIGLIDGKSAKEVYDRPSAKDFYSLFSWKKHGNMKEEDWAGLADAIAGELPL